VAFLADGIGLGQRLMYISEQSPVAQRAALAPLGDLDGRLERGELELRTVSDVYETLPIDPETQLAVFRAATDRALADGYTGLRVAADATPLVLEPSARDAHVSWESIADRYMAEHPLAALCGYDERMLPRELLAELDCVHPAGNEDRNQLPFRVAYLDGDTLALEGEVDTFSADALARLLRLTSDPTNPPVELDAGRLRFIDHHGLMALADGTRERALTVRNLSAVARELCELLELQVARV
jgi:ABC-type transporter Mla MlaB component